MVEGVRSTYEEQLISIGGSFPIDGDPRDSCAISRGASQSLGLTQVMTLPVAYTVLDTRIVSQHRPEITFYTISKPLNTATSILTLSSIQMTFNVSPTGSMPLYTLEYLGEDNALYIRSQSSSPTSYPGFGELKYSRHLTGKRWELRYENGKKLVLSRRMEKERQDNRRTEAKILTRWFNGSGDVLATETNNGLELIRGQEVEDQITGLLVAAWLARVWHAETAEQRALVNNAGTGWSFTGSSKRGDWNRFFSNVASGM